MTGEPRRAAVQLGSAVVRVAAAGDGQPWLVGELPVRDGRPTVTDAVDALLGSDLDELVLVHPAAWPADRVAALRAEAVALAAVVRAVPAAVAVGGPAAYAVLDVGNAGAEAVRVEGARVAAVRASPVGGARLDAVVAERLGVSEVRARAWRERRSLHPDTPAADMGLAVELAVELAGPVQALRDVLTEPVPVLLVGGLARDPLLAELVDAAGVGGAVVAARPDAAAVLGALAGPAAPVPPALRPPPPPVARGHRRPWRSVAAAAAAAGCAAALLAAGTLVPEPVAVPAGVLVQYGYRLDVPAGWEHGGGEPGRRRVLLTRESAPAASDLIAVELSELGYDTAAEPDRARAELRAEYDRAVAAGSALSGYDDAARVAGRPVTTYLEDAGGTVVDWAVVLDGDAQLSVGCRRTAAGTEAVRAACAVVLASVRRW